MSRRDYIRASLLLAASDLFPPLIREALISDAGLRREYQLKADAVIALGMTGVAFKRSELFAAIRRASRDLDGEVEVLDESGSVWFARFVADELQPLVVLRSEAQSMRLGRLALLSEDADLCQKIFWTEVHRLNLPQDSANRWHAIIANRSLDDEEISDLLDDFNRTPVAMHEVITEHLAQSSISINILVPRSVSYYERLVGKFGGQEHINSFVEDVLTTHLSELVLWNAAEGLKHCLLLCSHSLVSNLLSTIEIETEALLDVLRWAAAEGDVLSRVGLVEAILERATRDETVRPAIIKLGETFSKLDGSDKYNQFEILSATFVAVYGELGRNRLLATKPPYWRRLAAIAHAALIVRCIMATNVDLAEFVDWLKSIRAQPYFLHCYVDLRLEPLWLPEFALAPQLKNELIGRVFMKARQLQTNLEALHLPPHPLTEAIPKILSQIELIHASLPGPLEGAVALQDLPTSEALAVRQALETQTVDASSFTLLVNFALLFNLKPELTELATEALRRAQFKIDDSTNSELLVGSLVGLATTAAVTRCTSLADMIFATLRDYRYRFREELDVSSAFVVGIIACASRSDVSGWAACVGSFISDLAFQDLTRDEASATHTLAIQLCDLMPELWATCGQGLAALEAVAASRYRRS